MKNLKQAGYVNVKKISVVKRIDSPEICNANIIFVDINGVGESLFPKEQGLGVAKAIKNDLEIRKFIFIQHSIMRLIPILIFLMGYYLKMQIHTSLLI